MSDPIRNSIHAGNPPSRLASDQWALEEAAWLRSLLATSKREHSRLAEELRQARAEIEEIKARIAKPHLVTK